MGRIKLLDEAVSSRIAAGEVVQRPASIVKELVENSVDAGATAISVIIEEGGIKSIRVSDNGVGIHKDDLPMTIVKHATSKISTTEDLDRIFSMGFRGEALFSVASVSRLTINSRMRNIDSGYRLTAEEGKVMGIEPVAVAEGTTVISEDLFYNTPARLKFLSAPAKEAAVVSSVMVKLILAYPNVSIKYTSNGRVLYHSPGTGVIDSLICVHGIGVKQKIIEINATVGEASVTGYVSKPPYFEKSSKYRYAFVNNRAIDATFIAKEVAGAYGERILKGEFPLLCLYFKLPFEDVDVNVHPNKLTVRFADEKPIFLVKQGISDAMTKLASPTFAMGKAQNKASIAEVIEEIRPIISPAEKTSTGEGVFAVSGGSTDEAEAESNSQKPYEDVLQNIRGMINRAGANEDMKLSQYSSAVSEKSDVATYEYEQVSPPKNEHNLQSHEAEDANEPPALITDLVDFTYVGSVFETYIIIEHKENMYFIDQHAAHERQMYDKLLSSEVVAQPLLISEVVNVTHEGELALQQNADLLHKLGFEFEEFGALAYKFTSVPMVLGDYKVGEAVADVINELQKSTDVAILKDRIAKRACRLAVKGGWALAKEHAEQIVREIILSGSIPHCPHGRPVAIAIGKNEIERGFRRRV